MDRGTVSRAPLYSEIQKKESMRFQRLRGFQDILAEEARRFAELAGAARRVFRNFGFEEVIVPLLERREVFSRALGEETDVVRKEMYEFEDRSKTRVVLRPEGTAGVVRAYLENDLDKKQGLAKLFYAGPMFRSERPQAGRQRQFHQIGAETLGTESPWADAEMIHCLDLILKAFGVSGYEIQMNNLGTFEERERFTAVLHDYLKPHEKSLCEDCRFRLGRNVLRVLDCKVESCRAVAGQSPPISGFLSSSSREHFETVLKALEAAGVAFKTAPRLVRGLDYYTKTVFEVTHPRLGAQDAVAAGGRYDGLLEAFGGKAAGAVGFALGVERLLRVPVPAVEPEFDDSCFIAALGDTAIKTGFVLLARIRKEGMTALMDFESRSLKSQMRSAGRNRSRWVVILGEDELQSGRCILKNMKDGLQENPSLGDVVEVLRRKLL